MKKNLFDLPDSKKVGEKQWDISRNKKVDVAIIGIGLKFSGCNNPHEYWDLIQKGEDRINFFPAKRQEEMNQLIDFSNDTIPKAQNFKKASYLDHISLFDHGKYKLTKSEAILMSPKQRLFLEVAHQAIEDAGLSIADMSGTNTGVFVGHSSYGYQYVDFLKGLKNEYFQMAVPGNIEAIIPSRISYLLDLKGPTLLIDTSCSSSMVAVYQAYKAITDRTCEMALAGGVRLMYYPQNDSETTKLGIESLDGKTRSFDDSSSGTGTGEGVACILMKPLDKAIKDKDPIYAILKGGAINQDGKSIGITAPNANSQRELLVSAWKNTGISPEDIGYIEAHGTGTKIGDPIEVNSISEAFKKYTEKKQFCAISSVKTNLGHLDSVAGIAGLIKACLSLKFKKIPKQIHFDYPNKEINFIDSPLYVNTVERNWPLETKKYCGISSFGLSGTNCHLILEEAPELTPLREEKEYYILPISSYSTEGLKQIVKNLRQVLVKDSTMDLYSLGYNLVSKIQRSERLVFITDDKIELIKIFEDYLNDKTENNLQLIYSNNEIELKIIEQEKRMIYDYLENKDNCFNDYYKKNKSNPLHIPVFPDKPIVCWPGLNELEKKESQITINKMLPMTNDKKILYDIELTNSSIITLEELNEKLSNYIKSIFDLDKVDVHQSFFELGFDSISIIQLQQYIKNEYKLELGLEQLYQELNTVEELIGFIFENTKSSDETLEKNEKIYSSRENVSLERRERIHNKVINYGEGESHLFKEIFDKQLEVLNGQLDLINNFFDQQVKLDPKKIETKTSQKQLSDSNHFKAFKKIVKEKNIFTTKQKAYLEAFINAFEKKTIASKKFANDNRNRWANNRNVSLYIHDWKELTYPIIAKSAEGAYMWDLDNNKYIDFSMGFGVYLLGYNHDHGKDVLLEQGKTHNFLGPISTDAAEVAKLIQEIAKVERVAFYNSGTEAVMVAIRLARGATNKKKIVVFAGSYHGTFDGINVDQATDYSAIPLTLGTLQGMVDDVLVLNYGTKEAIEIIKAQKDEIAAVLVEPVQSRRVDYQPKEYLRELREITENGGIALIFDEVITGFRISLGGAQEHFNVKADIVTYGKILGGGMPIGVVAGKSNYLDMIDGGKWNYGDDSYPSVQRVVVAGTFCHHPLTMRVTANILNYLKEKGNSIQYSLNRKVDRLVSELNTFFETYQLPLKANNFGSMFNIKPKSNLEVLTMLKYHLLHNNIFVWEGATCFISEAHTDEDIQFFIDAVKKSIYQIKEGGFLAETISQKLDIDRDKNFNQLYELPLSIEQKRMFAKIQMDPNETIAFNETVIVEVKKKINLEMLQAAFNLVSTRHEVLRVVSLDEQVQKISNSKNVIVKNTSKLEEGISKKTIASWASKNTLIPFDLANGPFLKCYVLKTSDDSFVLQLVAHHIVIDGWSLNLLLKELNEIYESYTQNLNTSLAISSQYSHYLGWVDSQIKGEKKDKNLNFWKKEFSIEVPKFEVPMFNIKESKENNSGLVFFELDRELVYELKKWNSKNKLSTFTTLLSAYKILLSSFTGNVTTRIGIPYAGQLNSRLYDVVGQCVQMIPFISTLDIELTPVEYVNELAVKNLKILEHSVIPVDLLMEDAITRKGCLYEDLVVFNLDKSNSFSDEQNKSNEEVMLIANQNKYDLFFDAMEKKDSILFRVEYNKNKYHEINIQEWISIYKSILKCFVENEEMPLKRILEEKVVV